MIDENKLLRELEDWKHMDKDMSEIVLMAIDTFEKIVKEQPQINEWVSVEEKLPSKKGRYLCTFKPKSEKVEKTLIGVKYFDGFKWEDIFNLFEVIAWQPLPTPYKVPTFCKMETVECSYEKFIRNRFNRRY